MPTTISPRAVLSEAIPRATSPTRTSPLAVLAVTSGLACSTSPSPWAVVTVIGLCGVRRVGLAATVGPPYLDDGGGAVARGHAGVADGEFDRHGNRFGSVECGHRNPLECRGRALTPPAGEVVAAPGGACS